MSRQYRYWTVLALVLTLLSIATASQDRDSMRKQMNLEFEREAVERTVDRLSDRRDDIVDEMRELERELKDMRAAGEDEETGFMKRRLDGLREERAMVENELNYAQELMKDLGLRELDRSESVSRSLFPGKVDLVAELDGNQSPGWLRRLTYQGQVIVAGEAYFQFESASGTFVSLKASHLIAVRQASDEESDAVEDTKEVVEDIADAMDQ